MSLLQNAIAAATDTLRSLATLETEIERASRLIRDCLTNGNKLLVCGNGGSAADGADFSTEFACRFVDDRRPFPAINLSAGGSLLTATGNDYGFEEIYARQVRAFGKKGDVLVAISTSGNSRNILRAVEEASASGLSTITLLGRDGGVLHGLATVELLVAQRTTARIQEAHKFLLHVICELIEPALQAET